MANIMQNIASIVWLALAVIVFIRLKQWDKMFSSLYDELKKKFEVLTMAEYIEREALKQSIRNMPRTFNPELVFNSSVQKIISNAPTADVVEVRRGEWVKDTRTADVCAEYRCSLCGFMYCEADPKYPPYKYCPECGSKNE